MQIRSAGYCETIYRCITYFNIIFIFYVFSFFLARRQCFEFKIEFCAIQGVWIFVMCECQTILELSKCISSEEDAIVLCCWMHLTLWTAQWQRIRRMCPRDTADGHIRFESKMYKELLQPIVQATSLAAKWSNVRNEEVESGWEIVKSMFCIMV